MFTYLLSLLAKFQSRPVQKLLILALAVLVAAVVLATLARWLRRRGRAEGWPALAVAVPGNVLKVLAALGLLAVISAHLRFQSGEFARRRGGVSQRAYNAVKTIWGRPHVQRELRVRAAYTTVHYYDKDWLELDGEKLKATSRPVGFRTKWIEHPIPGDPILQAEHDVTLWPNYRRKGSGLYPGFEVNCSFRYRVANLSDRQVVANFAFPLPQGQGVLDGLSVTVDGKVIDRELAIEDESLSWKLSMGPRQEADVAVSYHSRGLEYLRFDPGSGRQLRKYRVRMLCRGIAADQVNYPIGCMTPTEKKGEGPSTVLRWDLDGAVTRLGMGVIVPRARTGGRDVARVLAVGPWGLVLLLAMVLVTHLVADRPLRPVALALLAVAYHLCYLLTAHLGDYWPGLLGGMLISAAATTAIVALLHVKGPDRFSSRATLALLVFFAVAYPLMRISTYDGLLMSVLYVAMLAYTVVLIVRARPRAQAPQA